MRNTVAYFGRVPQALWVLLIALGMLAGWAVWDSRSPARAPTDGASQGQASAQAPAAPRPPNPEDRSPQRTSSMNHELRTELENLRDADQALRVEAMEVAGKHGRASPEYQAFREKGLAQEKEHIARLVEIVDQHGWPTVRAVGEKAASGAFLILQHTDLELQKRFLPLMRAATEAGDIPSDWLPLLEDRVLMAEGNKQIYGTQITRGADGRPELWPIEDAEHVHERRARVGLEPLSEYLKRFGLEYAGDKR